MCYALLCSILGRVPHGPRVDPINGLICGAVFGIWRGTGSRSGSLVMVSDFDCLAYVDLHEQSGEHCSCWLRLICGLRAAGTTEKKSLRNPKSANPETRSTRSIDPNLLFAS